MWSVHVLVDAEDFKMEMRVCESEKVKKYCESVCEFELMKEQFQKS